MKRILYLLLMLCSSVVLAEEYPTGWREIEKIGCHLHDNTCYVTISGDPIGPPECNSTSLRWNETQDANGKSILALLMSAFHAGKEVSFQADSCYLLQPMFPTFKYINLNK